MEEAREGGFGNLGGRRYTIRLRLRLRQRRHRSPAASPPSPGLDDPAPPHQDGSEEGSSSGEEGGQFQGSVNIRAYASALWEQRQQQGKRGRVTASSEADILRLLRQVTPDDGACCSDCCAICLGDFADDDAAAADPLPLRAVPGCSHAFHKHCILKWLRLNAVCRRQLPISLNTEEEDEEEEEEEEHARRRSSRRKRTCDDWLALVAQHTRERQMQV